MDGLLEPQVYPTKAKPGLRYISTGIDYFLIMSVANTTYAFMHHNEIVKYIFIAVWFIYFPILEGITGQTLGKSLFKLKVVKKDFSPINLVDSIIRHLFDVIDFLPMFGILGLVIASANKSNQRVGDLIAKTIVIKV